jgi:hypothetical protein
MEATPTRSEKRRGFSSLPTEYTENTEEEERGLTTDFRD